MPAGAPDRVVWTDCLGADQRQPDFPHFERYPSFDLGSGAEPGGPECGEIGLCRHRADCPANDGIMVVSVSMSWEIPMNYRTPLARARGLGSAKEGVGHWWVQRLTAVALLPLLIWLVLALALLDGYDYKTLIEWVAQPIHAILLIVTVLALFWHSALGLQVIIEDYIGAEGLRLTLIVAANFANILGCIISIFAVLKIALG